MAVTKFKGPVNSVNGFQLNGTAVTAVGTRYVLAEGVASVVFLASDVGLSSVNYGFVKHNSVIHGATYIYGQIETSKNGVVGSAASFQLTALVSGGATLTTVGGNYLPASTVDILLLGAV